MYLLLFSPYLNPIALNYFYKNPYLAVKGNLGILCCHVRTNTAVPVTGILLINVWQVDAFSFLLLRLKITSLEFGRP